jgi:hypothetical protein
LCLMRKVLFLCLLVYQGYILVVNEESVFYVFMIFKATFLCLMRKWLFFCLLVYQGYILVLNEESAFLCLLVYKGNTLVFCEKMLCFMHLCLSRPHTCIYWGKCFCFHVYQATSLCLMRKVLSLCLHV